MKKIAFLFAGCGHRDGAEITETVSVLTNLALLQSKVTCFSLDKDILVTNHLTGKTSSIEKRNMLVEAARISRGQIQDLNSCVVADFDALIIAGGMGAALHFSTWAEKKMNYEVEPEVKRVIVEFAAQQKPIGAVCIAPILLAKCFQGKGITITLGPNSDAFNDLAKWGVDVVVCPVDDYITDRDNKLITTPAFMYDSDFGQVSIGIGRMVKELVEMA